jgi:hypothetical protein
MAPKYHPTPLSGGVLSAQADELRSRGEALLQKSDNLACQSWNERMWSDGGPIDPSPTINQAINGGFSWLEIERSRCKAPKASISALCADHQLHAFTTWLDGYAAKSAHFQASDHLLLYFN